MPAPFPMLEFITTKKSGGTHSPEMLDAFIAQLIDPDYPVPDYQVAAWLMAVCWRDLDFAETTALTQAMATHGRTCDWSDIGIVVDKHSTGGVGDKVSLALVPLVASLGIPVAKFSGRALGFTGGTLDKLESIPGFTIDLAPEAMHAILQQCGCVIAGQTADMVPADKALYALRDVTATIDNIALIAASIMSKKIAGGANGIVLDVKFGEGAFMQDYREAKKLAETMVAIGERTGRVVHAVLSSMEEPLGSAIGNALEVKEAIATLRGEGPRDFAELLVRLAEEMVRVYLASGGAPINYEAARIREHLLAGYALDRFRQWIELQGGDPRVADAPDAVLPKAATQRECTATHAGVVTHFATRDIGELVRGMGGGRLTKQDVLDPGVGLELHVHLGDVVASGQPLATIHARNNAEAEQACTTLNRLITIAPAGQVERPPLIAEVIGSTP